MTPDNVQTPITKTGSLAGDRSHVDRLQLYYSLLLETGQTLNSTSDFQELLKTILEKMLDLSRADSVIVLLSDEGNAFQFVGGRNANHKALGEEAMWLSQGIVERLHSSRDVVCIRDVAHDAALRNDVVLASRYLGAVVALPMLRNGSLLGFVAIGNRAAMPWIDNLDLSLLKAMASQLGLATDNAIAYGEIARLNDALETEVQERTTQLTQANARLADTLQQSEIKLAEQMEIDRRRSRFFSALAHELRAPIQLLLGHAYLTVEEGSERLTSLQHNSLTVILKTCEHLRDLIGKVMDASKLDEGGMSIDPAPFDVRPLIDDTLNLSRGFVRNKSVQLIGDYPPDLPEVVGDKTRIRQVLLNLLANACRYTDQGRVTVSVSVDGHYLVIGVTDTGTGIPADKLDAIFEPYIQADAVRSHGGAGLGLAISKQLVELHGGQLWVTSTVGSGSTFYFSLPTVMD